MNNLLIFGSGRSGTSMTAGMLRNSGYYMGDNYISPRKANPKGFFEDKIINDLNESLIIEHLKRSLAYKLKRKMGYTLPVGANWLAKLKGPISSYVDDRLAVKIRERTDHAPFCYKDPRFSYTLPAWKPHLPENTKFLIVFRDPVSTANSMIRESQEVSRLSRLRIDQNSAFSIWNCFYQSNLLLQSAKSDDFLFVHYNQLVSGEAIERLEAFSETCIDRTFADAKVSRTKPILPTKLPGAVELTYRQLCDLAMYKKEADLCV